MAGDKHEFRMLLPREALGGEHDAASADYLVGEASALPPDPDVVEAHFIDPVSVIVTTTLAMLAWRIISHILVKDGGGVLIDARSKPAVISRLEDIPAGYIVLIDAKGKSETIPAGKTDDSVLAGLIEKALAAAGG